MFLSIFEREGCKDMEEANAFHHRGSDARSACPECCDCAIRLVWVNRWPWLIVVSCRLKHQSCFFSHWAQSIRAVSNLFDLAAEMP